MKHAIWIFGLLLAAGCTVTPPLAGQTPPREAPQTVAGRYPAPQGDPMGGRGRGGASTPRNMKTLLIWADTRNGIAQHESVSHAEAVIERMGYETGAYYSYIRTDSNIISYHPQMTTGQPASGGPSLANVDAIFFLGHREVPIDAAQKAELLRYVHDDGKGLVAAHFAATAFASWPEFGELLGGRFDQHPWGVTTAPVVVEDPDFPGMQFFPRVFSFHDEFYQIKDFSAAESRVLMRLDTVGLDMTRPGVNPADVPYAITWAKMYGKGRVFYSALGHDAATWDNPAIERMWFNAIEWALGEVNADVKPRPVSSTVPPPPSASGRGH